jgi:catalase
MPGPSPSRLPIGSLGIIAIVIAVGAGAFAYTAGWLSPTRLTPSKIVDSLAPTGGPSLGHRRNHAKGVCFTGVFESNGNGVELSSAKVFTRGEYPALGRFSLATADANAPDSSVCSGPRPSAVDAGRRGLALRDDRSSLLPGLDAGRVL